jgi:hypothetical protein
VRVRIGAPSAQRGRVVLADVVQFAKAETRPTSPVGRSRGERSLSSRGRLVAAKRPARAAGAAPAAAQLGGAHTG